ncbi:MAG: group III truncated hemoglobin [Rhodobacteraceae bacterium]|nr:group III truncated hemoglobin [Paracoccaceae bacterium]
MADPEFRTPQVSAAEIDRVVRAFYSEVRRHSILGPVFAAHVPPDGWPAHEAKIAAFWRGVILRQPGFRGSPMGAHMRAGNVEGWHFDHWLGLFETVVRRELPSEKAAAWSDLARSIGRGLRMGVEDVRRPPDAIPKLG